jgi:hypothetical protein
MHERIPLTRYDWSQIDPQNAGSFKWQRGVTPMSDFKMVITTWLVYWTVSSQACLWRHCCLRTSSHRCRVWTREMALSRSGPALALLNLGWGAMNVMGALRWTDCVWGHVTGRTRARVGDGGSTGDEPHLGCGST